MIGCFLGAVKPDTTPEATLHALTMPKQGELYTLASISAQTKVFMGHKWVSAVVKHVPFQTSDGPWLASAWFAKANTSAMWKGATKWLYGEQAIKHVFHEMKTVAILTPEEWAHALLSNAKAADMSSNSNANGKPKKVKD